MSKTHLPQRFYSLDVVRGLAALSVVFWHWQHFFSPEFQRINFPFYDFFQAFYERGEIAVDFFFSLSGFIFFYLYSQPVSNQKISAWDFALRRFSRLYPLHFATLIAVALGQFFWHWRTGSYFIYGQNDPYHFILNLFFVSQWGFERGLSFNGPVWSVSVEVFLYLVFFIVCRFKLGRPLAMLGLTLIGLALHGFALGRGLFSFFLGGLVYFAYQKILQSQKWKSWKTPLFSILVLSGFLMTLPLSQRTGNLLLMAGLFPLTILTLAIWETERGHLGKRFSLLGDISYSSYLLHFPLQLAWVFLVPTNSDWYYSTTALFLFFANLILMSVLSHRLFEMPMQNFLRSKGLWQLKSSAVLRRSSTRNRKS